MNPASVDIQNFLDGHPIMPANWEVIVGDVEPTAGVPGVVRLFDTGAWFDYRPDLRIEHPIVKVKVEPQTPTTYADAFALAVELRTTLDKELASAVPMCEGAYIYGDIVGMSDAGATDIHFEVRLLRKAV